QGCREDRTRLDGNCPAQRLDRLCPSAHLSWPPGLQSAAPFMRGMRRGKALSVVNSQDRQSAALVGNQKLSLTRKVICRFPPEPPKPPGPKKNIPDVLVDLRKNGDAMLPTGVPLLLWLR